MVFFSFIFTWIMGKRQGKDSLVSSRQKCVNAHGLLSRLSLGRDCNPRRHQVLSGLEATAKGTWGQGRHGVISTLIFSLSPHFRREWGIREETAKGREGPIWDPGRRKSPKAATHPGSLVVWFCRENRQVRLPPAPWHHLHTEPSTCLRWLEKAELSGGSQLGYHILALQQRAVWRGVTRGPKHH